MSGVMDSRLLPPGFVWGMAIVVVYTVARALAFGFDVRLALICGMILSALLAAVYTHAKESSPPAGGKRAWVMGFWGVILVTLYLLILNDIEAVLAPNPAEDVRHDWIYWCEGAAFFALSCLIVWSSVRGPFIVRAFHANKRKMTPETWGITILAVSVAGFRASVDEATQIWLLIATPIYFVVCVPVALIIIYIRQRKKHQTKKGTQRPRPP